MSRIDRTFAALRESGEKGLIVYLTAGDPTPDASLEYMAAAVEGGADILEVGVPFSDPMADGPTIQAASSRALAAGMTLSRTLSLVSDLGKRHDVPVVLFGYYNPFFRYGASRLCRDAREAGVDGVLIVDLPLEESEEMVPAAREAGLDWIALASPTSGPERIRRAAGAGSGFLYLISVTGITGVRDALPPGMAAWTRHVKTATRLPVAVGFGISGPEMARAATRWADAAVVGSACVKVAEEHGASPEGPAALARFVRTIKQALNVRRPWR